MDANDKFRFLHNHIIEPLRQACEKEIIEIEQQVLVTVLLLTCYKLLSALGQNCQRGPRGPQTSVETSQTGND